jgi:hypothetical protein
MKNRVASIFGGLGFSIVIALIFIVGLEGVSWVILKRDDSAYPLFYALGKNDFNMNMYSVTDGNSVTADMLDPHTGYSYDTVRLDQDPDTPGFVVYPNDPNQRRGIKIVTLGGSTTDAQMSPDNNWPKNLRLYLMEEGIQATLFNGGVIGYKSYQETFKLIRDVLPLKPDLIITYDGINDYNIGPLMTRVEDTPMTHPYQKALMLKLLSIHSPVFPNIVTLFQKMNNIKSPMKYFGGTPQKGVKPYEEWGKNIRLMQAVCNEFGVKHIAILQPVLGEGTYMMNQREISGLIHKEKLFNKVNNEYLQHIWSYYKGARKICGELPFCLDFVDIFADSSAVYSDQRHLNDKGNRFIAKSIASRLIDMKILDPNTDRALKDS